jgi:hypothetical protein
MTVAASARSRTSVAIGPGTDRAGQSPKPGILGISPNVGLRPVVPQNADGMRIDPPPSVPIASGTMPLADAAASPLGPPAGRLGS